MSTSTTDLEQALHGLREGFNADGADLQIDDVDQERATIRLVGDDDTCWDCIVPPNTLRMVVTATLQKSCPSLQHVEIVDPRADRLRSKRRRSRDFCFGESVCSAPASARRR